MNRTIWKYTLPVEKLNGPPFALALPKGAEILHFGAQYNTPTLWVRADPDMEVLEPRLIALVGTGHPAPGPEDGRYVGTAQLFDGRLVLHLFEQQ